MLEQHSPLDEALNAGGRDGTSSQRLCQLGEIRGWSLCQIAGFPSTEQELAKAVERVLGLSLPDGGNKVFVHQERRVFRTAPRQFWILSDRGEDIDSLLEQAIDSSIGAVTSLSSSRTRLFIKGSAAREILAKGIAIDLDSRHFGEGQFAMTGLHHTPILLFRPEKELYEIWAMRTFALDLWEWLIDSAWPFGYNVKR